MRIGADFKRHHQAKMSIERENIERIMNNIIVTSLNDFNMHRTSSFTFKHNRRKQTRTDQRPLQQGEALWK